MTTDDCRKRILFINNSLVRGNMVSENFIPHFRHPYDAVNVIADKVPEEGNGYSHIILSGSGADFEGAWQERESSLIRWAYDNNVPLLGVCYGHQMIVKTLYGIGCLGRMDEANYGWHRIRCEKDDDIFGNGGSEYSVFSHHFWEVKEVPESEVEIFASSHRCRISGIRIKNKKMWGLQPHFEIGVASGVSALRKVLGDEKAWENIDVFRPEDSGHICHIMQHFLFT
jgi:GMP synthase (glutamine-hydrolysing)